ncbi:MAG TPA: ABC transporter substrate-binding protein [Chloroflexota bacterium]|jgi:ABC-type nitrate/sulfonate/bicarbonate transport system substrate-binding protein
MSGRWRGELLSVLVLASWCLACASGGGAPGGSQEATGPRAANEAAVAAAGAGPGSSQAAAEATAPPAVRQLDVPLASSSATITPFWVAAEQSIFQRYGLDVALPYMPPATATQALTAGSVLIAAVGGSTVTAWVGGSAELVFVAGVSNKAPYRVMARPEITRLEDLRGKTVGLTTPGASPSVLMLEVLRRAGLEADRDVTVSYLRDPQADMAALLTGAVNATAVGSPVAEYGLAEGARLLLDMRELNLPILGINVGTTRGLVQREPDLLRRFLMAYVEAVQYARDTPEAAISATMEGARVDDRALAELAYLEYREIWDPWPSEAGVQTILDNLDDPAARTARSADVIDDRFLRELEQSGWLAAHLRAR